MATFYTGERVVFINKHMSDNDQVITPNNNEIVTISGYEGHRYGYDFYFIKEYPFAKNGRRQTIDAQYHLRPLSEVSSELSEEILNSIKPEIPVEV